MKNNFYKFIIIFFIIIFFKVPQNLNEINNSNHEKRLSNIYGYCYPQGYGFIKEIKKKYNLSNIETTNFGDFAQSDFFLDNPNQSKSKNYKILINYNLRKDNNLSIDQFKIVFSNEQCFLITND